MPRGFYRMIACRTLRTLPPSHQGAEQCTGFRSNATQDVQDVQGEMINGPFSI